MRDNYKEPPLTYALDPSDKMVHISSVKRGLDCRCRCSKCNEYLEAKLGYGGRQAHFAHKKDSDCHGAYMSALHKLAEQIIEEEKAVMVPKYKEIDKQKLEFEKVEVEQRVERKDLQPDIVGVTSDGLRWFIEIRNTHEIDKAKRAKLIAHVMISLSTAQWISFQLGSLLQLGDGERVLTLPHQCIAEVIVRLRIPFVTLYRLPIRHLCLCHIALAILLVTLPNHLTVSLSIRGEW